MRGFKLVSIYEVHQNVHQLRPTTMLLASDDCDLSSGYLA